MALEYVVTKRVFGFDDTKTEKYVAKSVRSGRFKRNEKYFRSTSKSSRNAIRSRSCWNCTRIFTSRSINNNLYCFSRIITKNT